MRLHQTRLASEQAALVILCKRRRLMAGSPQLAAAIGPEGAAEVAQVTFACALEDAQAWPGPVVIALAQAADLSWAGSLMRPEWSILSQSGGNAGERINAIDQQLRRHGARSLVYVGTNAPVQNETDYAAARAALENADVALAPAMAGGITLMANRRPWPDLAALAWNTSRLGAELAYLCEREGLRVAKLPRRYEINAPADLTRIAADLATDVRARRVALRAFATRVLAARVM